MYIVAWIVIGVSTGLYLLLLAGFAFRILSHRRRRATKQGWDACRVSILKPLAGIDEALQSNLESFTSLDWPDYELLLGVTSVDDPAYAVACDFLRAHPNSPARIILTDPQGAQNPKVAQLLCLERRCSGTILVISDSNVRVRPNYLRSLIRELSRPRMAMVSSAIVGTQERSTGAALTNLQLSGYLSPGVLALQALTGQVITVGKSMAIRRRVLSSLGGFARVANVLAEDEMLGRLFTQAGYEIGVCVEPIENPNVHADVTQFVDRQLRWCKLRRRIAPLAFLFEPMTYPFIVSSLVWCLAPNKDHALAMIATALLQILGAQAATRTLRGVALPWRLSPLELVRSYLMFGCWCSAWFSKRVLWRGHAFELGADSRIVPLGPDTSWTDAGSPAQA